MDAERVTQNEEPRNKNKISMIKTVIVKQGFLLSDIGALNTPQKAVQFAQIYYEGADREYVFVCTVDNKCHPISIEMASMGTMNQALISPREIFKSAILSCSAGILLFHNHISGNPEPSVYDIQTTKRLKESGDIVGISLMDHIIIGDGEQFVSLRERKIIGNSESTSSYVTE